jgi:hypothetical protein
MVERTIAWLVANGHRRCRHRGIERNKIAFTTRAAVINLKRLIKLGLDHDPLCPSGQHASQREEAISAEEARLALAPVPPSLTSVDLEG